MNKEFNRCKNNLILLLVYAGCILDKIPENPMDELSTSGLEPMLLGNTLSIENKSFLNSRGIKIHKCDY